MTVGITELPPEGMQLGGVALAGDADRGTKTTEGLSLLFTTAGITVQGPQPQIERLLVWSGLDSASCREKIDLPDGRNAAVMELTSGGQSIRFLLPMDAVTPGQAAYLDQALPAWLARYKGTAAPVVPAGAGGRVLQRRAAVLVRPARATRGSLARWSTGRVAGGAGRRGRGRSRWDSRVEQQRDGAGSGRLGVGDDRDRRSGGSAGTTRTIRTTRTTGAADIRVAGRPIALRCARAPGPGTGAPVADPATPSFVARSATGSLPPADAPPPPPGLMGADAPPAATGWATPTEPLAEPTGWGNPPVTDPPDEATDPAKRSRSWRKGRPPTEPEGPTPEFFSPMRPPAEPPADPTPLKLTTPLPPPPAEAAEAAEARGPVIWKPPIDPVTGEPVWDQRPEGLKGPKKRKGWRRGAKDGAVVAAGAAAGATGAAAVADHVDAPAPATVAPDGGAGADSFAGTLPPITPDPGHDASVGAQPPKRNRALLTVLLVLLVAVIGGIAYFAVKRSSNTTPTTVATAPAPSPSATDTALAASINLRLTDLPNDWGRSPVAGQPAVPAAPASAQIRADQALASCVAQPYALVAGLFGSATVPGAGATVNSPTFRMTPNPGIQMSSRTVVMGTVAGSQVQESPFVNPKFTTCFTQYQTALATAAVAGSTATVQQVTLPVPAGVRSFGYLTTFNTPGGGTVVKGEAFIFGGRIVNRLVPVTNGPAVPQADFAAAYDSITQRVAQAANR